MNTGKQVNIMVILIFLGLVVLGGYTLWDPLRADEAEEEQQEKTAERGAFLFAQNCRACHGDSGEGGALSGRLPQAPPLDRADLEGRPAEGEPVDETLLEEQFTLIENTIACGRVGTAMPLWAESEGGSLNDEQIRQLTVMITSGAWDEAHEFAEEIDATGIELEAPGGLSADETELTLTSVEGFIAGSVIRIDEEKMSIEEVDEGASQVVVERGVRATQPGDHEDGAEVFNAPAVPEGSINTEACGQRAQVAPTPAEATPEATPEGTPAATPEGTPEATPAAELPGKDVFLGAVGCSACHTIEGVSSGTVGPELTDIGSVADTRVEGLSAEEYIRESIEDPSSFLAPGFPNAMPPGLQHSLSDEEFEQLIEYLLSLD